MSKNKIVSDARRKQILRETTTKDCAFICHKSPEHTKIACRGHYDATGGGQLARIAGRLGVIVEIDPDTLHPVKKPEGKPHADNQP